MQYEILLIITNWYFESEIFTKYLRLQNLSNKLGIYRKKNLFRENINDDIAKNKKFLLEKKNPRYKKWNSTKISPGKMENFSVFPDVDDRLLISMLQNTAYINYF